MYEAVYKANRDEINAIMNKEGEIPSDSPEIDKFKELFIPFLLTAIPLLLIALQPDLGSAVLFLPLLFP